MKQTLLLFSVLISCATASAANGKYEACRTDGCEMRRNAQVTAVYNATSAREELQPHCASVEGSLLEMKRLSENQFRIKCGSDSKSSQSFLLTLTQDDDFMQIVASVQGI